MKHLLKQLAGESIIYGISSMLSRFIGIFLVPLYTRLLLPADYGALSLVNSTFYFIIVLAVFALDSAAARWYYDTEDINERKKTIASWFWFQLISSLILCSIIVLCSPLLSTYILKDGSKNILFIIPALGLLANILPTMVSNWLRFQRKAIHTVIFTVSTILINVGLNIFLVLYLKWGVKGILLSTLISNAIATLYVFTLMYEWILPTYFSKKILKDMLTYALPLLPTSLAFWVLNSSSAFVIDYYHTKTDVGLYQIAAMVASAVTMIVGAFQMAWGPFAFSIYEKPEAKQTYSMVLTLYCALMCLVALGVAMFAKEGLMLLTTKEYYGAYLAAGVLAFNGIIYGMAYIAIIGCSIHKDNKPLAVSVLFAAGITAILYFLLVPIWGIVGAALSTALGYLVVPIYLFYKSQKYWYIPYKFKIAIGIFQFSIFLYALSLSINTSSILINIALKSLLVCAYLVFLILIFKFQYSDEYQKVKHKLLPSKK